MSRIKEVTVSLDMTVQPKQYQSIKLGLSMTEVWDGEEDLTNGAVVDRVAALRTLVSLAVREGIRAEVETVYGKAAADYVVNQKGA